MVDKESGGDHQRPISLALGGSFFPLHEGHLDLLRSAKRYLENHHFKRVVSALLCPSHFSALQRKFDGLPNDEPDVRTEMAMELLEKQPSQEEMAPSDCVDFVWDDRLLRAPKNTGMRFAMEEIAHELQARDGIQLVQVVGADSQVRAVLRNPKLPVCLVVDSRGVPPENADLLASNSRNDVWVVRAAERDSRQLPPLSSTMLRFLNPERFHPSVVPSFNMDWLTDTGQTLGAGRQGLVRLMRVGRMPVAVKIYKRAKKASNVIDNCFVTEEPVWHTLEKCRVTPPLITTGTMSVTTNHDSGSSTRDYSYIVSKVGIPFDKLLPKLQYTYYWQPKDVERFRPFLDCFASFPLPEIPVEFQPTLPTTLNETWALKAQLIRGMIECQERLEKAGIVHRDLKVSNFVQLQDGSVGIVDFGTARTLKNLDPATKSPRGSMRMYPLIAIDSFYFDYGCDEYVLANSIFEILNETPIYADCGEDVSLAIGKRRNNQHPTWNPDLLQTIQDSDETKVDITFLRKQMENCESIWKAYEIGDGCGGGRCCERRQPGKGRFLTL